MGQHRPNTVRRAPATNRCSNSQVSGQTNDQTSLTGASIPRRQFKKEVEKQMPKAPGKVVMQIALDEGNEWENWAADHRESALGVTN